VRITREYEKSERHQGIRGSSIVPNIAWRNVTRWEAKNLKTGRTIVIKSAQRLRPLYPRHEGCDPAFSELGP
jgi:hypothetical protein